MKKLAAACVLMCGVLGMAHAGVAPVLGVSAVGTSVGDLVVLHDGVFPTEGTSWTDVSTVNWTGFGTSFTLDLGQVYVVSALDVSVDNNDDYLFEYSLDGSSWATLAKALAAEGNVGWGLDTMSSDPASAAFVAGLGIAQPVSARYIRASATAGDSLNSIGEIQISGVPVVPEPATWSLVLAGAAVVGVSKRRWP